MKNILLIAGTRPNFIKLAPLYHRLKTEEKKVNVLICHTGQHFDFNMSDVFWQNLELPAPDFQLNVKGLGVVDTIGKTILSINEVIKKHFFDLIIVFGDVNATASGAIVGAQSGIPVMHVESGLRSFDREMPEEINRIITDHISNYLMVSEQSGLANLEREGFEGSQYLLVGNIMIECLLRTKSKWESIQLPELISSIEKEKPIIATFHRPENVDKKETLIKIVDIICRCALYRKTIFPIHPRTKSRLEETGLIELLSKNPGVILTAPLSYFEFLNLISKSEFVITDSGGVQEETSFLNIPCITFRKNTERPITVELGTNLMMRIEDETFWGKITHHVSEIKNRPYNSIPYWDEMVSTRIVEFILEKI
jgi:UDP-N-acetylglucosamine 2-epimerase (non-hydrolysing)